MKLYKIITLIVFALVLQFSISQESHVALELTHMNIAYRGVVNPMRIASTKGKVIEATAPGLKKIDDFGNYELRPRTGKTLDIKIKTKSASGKIIIETKKVRILDIKRIQSLFNGKECYKCELKITKQELISGRVDMNTQDFLFDANIIVKGFEIQFPNKKTVSINGNKITEELKSTIMGLRKNDLIQIFGIKTKIVNPSSVGSLRYCKISSILIRIVN